jgi:Co/Zn/Cd efflux system component
MAGLLINAAVPLMKTVVRTLMMTSPIPSDEIKKQILTIEKVCGVHELHMWQYVSNKEVSHVHVVVRGDSQGSMNCDDYNFIS